ncbi:TrmH family RNA methyltransferase [Novipirellula artificiosorum]|uniref:tRNA (Guanosine(18)-2'-O)-methyltransferase n=1 Tax=Novipirellula artificiosorum TaxID=2528016 RepID=A0A5C6DWU7_9BACT|nr:RNA methyltransferase [Novipirellula artificiosorum]TWU40684.1 tRNA (guanosine(18)-2'-O)-methyltransferase [Novipirellula artificiosorum]
MSIGQAIPIASLEDPRISVYANLRHRDVSADGGRFVAEGHWVVKRLIASSYTIESLLVQQGLESKYADGVPESVPIFTLSRDRLGALVGFDFHRGVLACGLRPRVQSAQDFLNARPRPRLAVMLLGVTELENVGSILRSAAAFGIDHILFDDAAADPLSRRVVRVSMATVFKHQLFSLDRSAPDWLTRFHEAGFRTLAATLDPSATAVTDFASSPVPRVLMVGNEAKGIDPSIQALATDRITIPMQLGTDSLNVAVASAILMHALRE